MGTLQAKNSPPTRTTARSVACSVLKVRAKKRLRELVEEGLSSGSGRTLTPKVAAELKEHALGRRR